MKLIDEHFETYKAYFEQFVTPEIGLKAYYCDFIETVMAASRSEESFGYPLLHLEYPQIRFEEKSEMLMVHFDSVGVVLVHADEDSPTAKAAAIKIARQIWDKIFSEMKKASVFKDILIEFSLNNVRGEVVLPTFVDRTYGYEFRFVLTFWAQGHLCDDDED
ncbi:hypothetical protein [Runella sp.]|uniref:hypothetical protein n=1 Tax=Runella sp. TaxID=1960881 RepID=UPI003D0A9803